MRAKVVQEEIKQDETTLCALRVETKNANFLLLSEGEDQLGTLAVAMPPKEKMLGPAVSSVLLGDKNAIFARLLAERLAQKTGKIGLASIFAGTISDRNAGTVFLQLLEKTFAKEEKEKEKP
jgi:hypothetical protein